MSSRTASLRSLSRATATTTATSPGIRLFSATARRAAPSAHRALVFREHGALNDALSAHTFRALSPPGPGRVNVRVRLAPVNPSDVNVVEGVYPNKPSPETLLPPDSGGTQDFSVAGGEPVQSVDGGEGTGEVYVPGNEGVAEVTAVGEGVSGLEVGDWVVFAKTQPGTWASARQVGARDVIRVDKDAGEVTAAMLSVNPPTALCLLREFVPLKEGDWIVQNGANSAVGQLVIQIAAQRGIRTLNFVRSREEQANNALVKHLGALGATHTFTYDALADRTLTAHIKQLTHTAPPRLLLNCVSGPQTTGLLRLLGQDAQLVSYGAMSKQPLALPAGAQIFRGLVARGFWMSAWYAAHARKEREALLEEVVRLKLEEPRHTVFTVQAGWSDEEAGRRVREALGVQGRSPGGEKVLLRVEDPVV
ncbi:NAD-P-binding protein [Rhodofomes roseus]|uniref:enoyl-[acyl-carrier-protein] reductase n=1 Tax=Rhodofomes roseus TaxID=34475 RepID=A0ABQ8KR40_9APHY|nr:NAD-P-binding protein [Rhodofomes roseus]KAH9840852.1 NAD-P-binding protein [Rhodofomes roseus]